MQAVPLAAYLSLSYIEVSQILPTRSTSPDKKYNYKCTLVKSDSNECKTTFWSAEK